MNDSLQCSSEEAYQMTAGSIKLNLQPQMNDSLQCSSSKELNK